MDGETVRRFDGRSIPHVGTPAQRTGLNIWEVQIRELGVEATSFFVVGVGGVCLVVEVAQMVGFVIAAYY